jgi:cohesin complex subunit SA-1/2
LLIQSAGCTFKINEEALVDHDLITEAINQLEDRFKQSTRAAFPLAEKKGSKFKRSFAEFWSKIVASLRGSNLLLGNQNWAEVLIAWLIAMSSSVVRTVRHTATCAALNFQTGVCQLASSISSEIVKLNKQKLGKQNRSTAQQSADERIKDLEQQKTRLAKIAEELFDGYKLYNSGYL